jgi:hypothetical protein
MLRSQKDKEKANSMKHGKEVKEETELEESHFKVGDKVKCKTSGMKGEVVKLDKEDGDEDDKYYTVKREDGKMKKMAPEDMTKINEASEKEEGQFHKKLDTLVHKTFGKRKEEMKEENIDEAMFPGTKEYEKKYGQSPQQKLKKVGDTEKTAQGEMKKTAKGVMHTRRFSEMLETYKEGGLKTIAEMLVKEEPSQEEFEKEVEEVKKKNSGEIRNDKGVAKAFQSANVREEPVNPVREEVEELDELSKSTLGSYVNKASRDASTSKASSANWAHTSTKAKNPRVKDAAEKYSDEEEARHNKRMAGIGQAVKKMTKEEVEELDELKKSTLGSYVKKASKDLASRAFDHGEDEHRQYGYGDDDEEDERVDREEKKIETRQKGIARAANRLAKEETLDELSKSTLGSYVKKSSKDLASRAFDHGEDEHRQYGYGDDDKEDERVDREEKKIETRQKGISRAANRLAKESTIEEREMTDAEMKKREDIVKGMKKGMQGFKQRYGDRAKQVIYATAGKMAKKD